ncbi:hypothetical protein C5022_000062 [Pseudomonas phage vB_PaeP_130_113]|uniref:Uncharacterized protein n=1 Tax=Pseudomonas phage vB_PaeP_130_113 TaxID=2161784 RepID=A0A2R4P9B9_9CAUD|nr:hypothetical protein HOT07_gp62 [Pseudomonas phage vB_PaeP_130_113]AVX47665.1 hypothetical protein C5022_000062 [Pseudomonas phage vB_PaeP_130_113]
MLPWNYWNFLLRVGCGLAVGGSSYSGSNFGIVV